MARAFRGIMDGLYWACAVLAGASLVLISVVIPYSVYTRYVLNRAASWPEPAAILLSIVLTFFGAAVCYRDGIHMRMMFFTSLMPGRGRRVSLVLAEALTALVSGFMIVWGYGLCAATWHDLVAEFPSLSVGVTYLPIPLGGAATLLFVIERLTIGEPAKLVSAPRPADFD
jgi:TRAP-type C4-dicarboxylate transport system permease small subunit